MKNHSASRCRNLAQSNRDDFGCIVQAREKSNKKRDETKIIYLSSSNYCTYFHCLIGLQSSTRWPQTDLHPPWLRVHYVTSWDKHSNPLSSYIKHVSSVCCVLLKECASAVSNVRIDVFAASRSEEHSAAGQRTVTPPRVARERKERMEEAGATRMDARELARRDLHSALTHARSVSLLLLLRCCASPSPFQFLFCFFPLPLTPWLLRDPNMRTPRRPRDRPSTTSAWTSRTSDFSAATARSIDAAAAAALHLIAAASTSGICLH